MHGTVTHVPTHLSPITCHLCRGLRHFRGHQNNKRKGRHRREAWSRAGGRSVEQSGRRNLEQTEARAPGSLTIAKRPPSVVKPTRSANRTDTSRRSATGTKAGPPGRAPTRGSGPTDPPTSAAVNGVAHSPQNLAVGGFGVPQFGHAVTRRAAHSTQNLRPTSLSVPQFAQITWSPSASSERSARPARRRGDPLGALWPTRTTYRTSRPRRVP